MEAAGKSLSYPWVTLLGLLLFFGNTLPVEGLTLSLLLLPVWIFMLHSWGLPVQKLMLGLAAFTGSYAAVHLFLGIMPGYYLLSTVTLAAMVIFGLACYHAFCRYSQLLDSLFRKILLVNFFLALLSLLLLFVPGLRDLVWYTISISEDIRPIPRLKLFQTEASHYSYLLMPVVIYFLARMLFFRVTQPAATLVFIFVPLILSFSLGVLLCLAVTTIVVLLVWRQPIFAVPGRKALFWQVLGVLAVVAVALYFFYPDNPLYHRLANVIGNKDTSARGRTYESFILAHQIAGLKSYLFGAGPGQVKVLGRDIIIQFYKYANMPGSVRLPNACAETIAWYGYLGLVLRLGLQVFLFFKAKVRKNPYRDKSEQPQEELGRVSDIACRKLVEEHKKK